MVQKPPRSLQTGQVEETWIEGIGSIRNHCVKAEA
jgi:2-keto-4-pentenoate hydratase/2-oxohepta-3-ene-1,7-dioic acid hydratase in catechol pathway